MIAATVTGNSDTADFKDTILADTSGVGISNCGQIRVTKDTNPEGRERELPVHAHPRPGQRSLTFDGSTSVPGTLTTTATPISIADLKVGTDYTLAEGPLAAEWTLESITCTKGGTTYDVVPGRTEVRGRREHGHRLR